MLFFLKCAFTSTHLLALLSLRFYCYTWLMEFYQCVYVYHKRIHNVQNTTLRKPRLYVEFGDYYIAHLHHVSKVMLLFYFLNDRKSSLDVSTPCSEKM